ncbi:MAG TPA: N,N-dimethylformamidase beta subunit family domain-containing protein [Gaiellaceae bacterium]|nr:N,N-dimethylformamidase beta subunit family domain-containing protein [Gaiellaceae bacterium]
MRRLAVCAVVSFAVAAPAHASSLSQPALYGLRASNGSTPFAGDTPLLTTVSPNGDGFRDRALITFRLRRVATVTMDVTQTLKAPHVVYTLRATLGPGVHQFTWSPAPNLEPRTYLVRFAAVDRGGRRVTYGAPDAFVDRYRPGVVVRVQGIDAGFTKPNALPGEDVRLHIATDEPSLTLRLFRSGTEHVATTVPDVMNGVEVDGGPLLLDWTRWRSAPHTITYRVPDLPSGLYFVQLTGPDGRVGYAPLVVRPVVLGETSRVLVVLPTNTWQAYNFQDVNGDGYGDTWYAGGPNETVDLGRAYLDRGVPPHFDHYDLPVLHWLYWTGKKVEFISDSDFDQIATGDELARAYDLIVFEGHEEYVLPHEYDVIQRYRDLGGNLMFLSANNFFWRIAKRGQVLERLDEWRQAGRPEAALIGTQYRANDDGQRQGLFVVGDTAQAPWFWDGTGLTTGSTFGQYIGGYGIEIDSTTAQSPPGTIVLAQIPNLYGAGLTAQMTYYETSAGAKVFAAGALDFGGSAATWPAKRLLTNLWTHLSVP